MSLLSSDCYFESLALQETFAGPQVRCQAECCHKCRLYTSPMSISPLLRALVAGAPAVEIFCHNAQQKERKVNFLQAISRLLDMLLLNLSADVHHVVECVTDGQSASALAVLWRVRGGQSNLLRAKVHALSCVDIICHHTCVGECKAADVQEPLYGPSKNLSLCAPQGITFMKVNGQNQICYIRDAPEHSIKALLQTAPVANLATSMLAR